MKKVDKVIIILVTICIVLALGLCCLVYFTTYRHKLEYRAYDGEEISIFSYSEGIPTKEVIICTINKLTNTNYKIRYDENFWGGYTRLFDDTIYIYPYLPSDNFAWVYAHEIYHHLAFTHNDLYVELETFKFLFNSGEPFLRYSAMSGLASLKKATEQYDARYYIYEYLNEIGFDIQSTKVRFGDTVI